MNIPPMQPKPQKKRAEKRDHDLEEEYLHQDQHLTKRQRVQNQIAPTQNPTRTPIAVTVNPAPPSHSATLPHPTYHSMIPPIPIPNTYATHQIYATPQHIGQPHCIDMLMSSHMFCTRSHLFSHFSAFGLNLSHVTTTNTASLVMCGPVYCTILIDSSVTRHGALWSGPNFGSCHTSL